MASETFTTNMELDDEVAAAVAATIAAATAGYAPRRSSAEACAIDAGLDATAGYDELMEAMGSDRYWYKFYLRPCCPAPGYETAKGYAERLKEDVAARADFTSDQAAAMERVIDERFKWYSGLGVCKA